MKNRILFTAMFMAATWAQTAQLAVRTYTASDGLASDQISALFIDDRGFLWVGTPAGLSRFDGVAFTTYDCEDGLPGSYVTDIIQTSDGLIWIGTTSGIALLNPSTASHSTSFEAVTLDAAHSTGIARDLEIDSSGALWVAIGDAVFRRSGDLAFELVDLDFPWREFAPRAVVSLAADQRCNMWIGTSIGLMLYTADGTTIFHTCSINELTSRFGPMVFDQQGRLWCAVSWQGILVVAPDPLNLEPWDLADTPRADSWPIRLPENPGEQLLLGDQIGLPTEKILHLGLAHDDTIWVLAYEGAFELGATGIHRIGTNTGLNEDATTILLDDLEGNRWIGGAAHGLMRMDRLGFDNFQRADGLATREIAAVTTDPNGEVLVVGFPPAEYIHELRGDRFAASRLPLPRSVTKLGWGLHQVTFVDHRGAWWVPTTGGLFRFPAVSELSMIESATPDLELHTDDGLGGEEIFRLFEDSRGDVWIAAFGTASVVRWDRDLDRLIAYDEQDGLPQASATVFAEDRNGNVWMGFYYGGLARYRDGSFNVFDATDGLPEGFIFSLLFDHDGRLWIGTTRSGLARVDDPNAEHLEFNRYSTANGLASNGITSLVEDTWGQVYIGGCRGIDRLDPETGEIEHFDTENGLVNNNVISSVRDRHGDLWFATPDGVSRLRPKRREFAPPRPTLITGLRVSGERYSVPVGGASHLERISLPPGTHHAEVEFLAVNMAPGLNLRYQHRFNDDAWTTPSTEHRIHLAGLDTGVSRLTIRALRSDGQHSDPATLSFDVARPVWQRWWFLATLGLSLIGAAWVGHRRRVNRLVEFQRVRARISADLHDELGLSLSRISMLSEVARQFSSDAQAEELLEEIGGEARSLIEATSDMAWALDPRQDSLGSLVARLRRLASDVFENQGIRFSILTPDTLDEIQLPAETRRNLYLIMKEALNNCARHAAAHTVQLRVARDSDSLIFEITDDGCGFDATHDPEHGQGMVSMARRAEEIGATLEVDGHGGHGTLMRCTIPHPA